MRVSCSVTRLGAPKMQQYGSRALSTAALQEEEKQFEHQLEDLAQWMNAPRFANTKRPYSARDVLAKRGSFPLDRQNPVNLQSKKLFDLLSAAYAKKQPVQTMGALDPVQMSQMAAAGLQVAYVSGWAASSTLTTARNEVGPDLADYPYTTVPNAVERIFKAQCHHDRKATNTWFNMSLEQRAKQEKPRTDYLRPIIADGDTGHGGLSTVMKLAKMFGESGASGVHFEDQLHGGKKCGHAAGKVLVPTSEHVTRLIAARLQWDIMGLETLSIARTDAESAKLISSTADTADHPFILGVDTGESPGLRPLAEELAKAEKEGASGQALSALEAEWMGGVRLVTFREAFEDQLRLTHTSDADVNGYLLKFDDYLTSLKSYSMRDMRAAAEIILGRPCHWDCDLPRTREGYYHFQGGLPAALRRAVTFAPYADMLWLETKTPDLQQAQAFAKAIHTVCPDKWLVYNLSPSFNWASHGFTDEKLKSFIWDLAESGFVLQLISLAGLHAAGVTMHELAQRYTQEGMLAYVNLIQQRERDLGCDVLTHQAWSGASLADEMLNLVASGSSSTQATGADSTEHTFT